MMEESLRPLLYSQPIQEDPYEDEENPQDFASDDNGSEQHNLSRFSADDRRVLIRKLLGMKIKNSSSPMICLNHFSIEKRRLSMRLSGGGFPLTPAAVPIEKEPQVSYLHIYIIIHLTIIIY